jgi:hypothetical protein
MNFPTPISESEVTYHIEFVLEETQHRLHAGPMSWNRAHNEAGALRNTRGITNVHVIPSNDVEVY